MANVSLRKLEKIYPNGFKAVHGIDLDIRDGEFMVFVGPSGCAKSTVLRMIAGLESISGGELRIGESVVNNLPPRERRIAMVFQNYALYPHMTVRANLEFGLKLSGVNKRQLNERVTHAARTLEIEHLLERLPKQLSGGQAQRVAVGRAIVKRPEVFLFDEPLSNLDAKLRASMRVRLTELHAQLAQLGQPSTVIYVTHDQTEAMTMGERICVLKDGTIQQVDTPAELYERPANAFVASFIGSPEMNLREARLVEQGGGVAIGVGNAVLPLPETKAARLRRFLGKTVRFGIRPEHIVSSETYEHAAPVVSGRVRLQENMGSEVFTHFDIDGVPFACRLPADRLGSLANKRREERHDFAFLMDKCHVFDAEDGANLTL
jgi:ABC-type sugar transport system ATPase subunit